MPYTKDRTQCRRPYRAAFAKRLRQPSGGVLGLQGNTRHFALCRVHKESTAAEFYPELAAVPP